MPLGGYKGKRKKMCRYWTMEERGEKRLELLFFGWGRGEEMKTVLGEKEINMAGGRAKRSTPSSTPKKKKKRESKGKSGVRR